MAITASPVSPLRSRFPRSGPVLVVSTAMSNPSGVGFTRIQSSEARGVQARAMWGPSSLTTWCGAADPCCRCPKCSSVSSGRRRPGAGQRPPARRHTGCHCGRARPAPGRRQRRRAGRHWPAGTCNSLTAPRRVYMFGSFIAACRSPRSAPGGCAAALRARTVRTPGRPGGWGSMRILFLDLVEDVIVQLVERDPAVLVPVRIAGGQPLHQGAGEQRRTLETGRGRAGLPRTRTPAH